MAITEKFRQRKGESENDFYQRIRPLFVKKEKDILAFFERRPGEPDGSFLENIFRLGWEKAKRKFSPKKA